MVRAKLLPSKFGIQIRLRMAVDIDHNLISATLVTLRPIGAVGNAAAYALRHKNHPRYQVARTGGALCLPYFCPCIRRWVM